MATIKFEETPLMRPTGALFLVTSMGSLPTIYTQDHIAVTMYGRATVLMNLQRSPKVAVDALNYYANYFQYRLPQKKIGDFYCLWFCAINKAFCFCLLCSSYILSYFRDINNETRLDSIKLLQQGVIIWNRKLCLNNL